MERGRRAGGGIASAPACPVMGPNARRVTMASAPLRARMSVELFRSFVEGRPDEEHWELVNGVAMMMAPPTLAHQRIASNLERLLLDALESHAPTMTAFQAICVNLGPAIDDYDPEPDVVVTDLAA